MEREKLKKTVKEILQNYGFKKIKNSFYFNTKDFLIVIDLQKSMYDDYYYLNYGFCIESMNDYMPYPKTYQCEINMRGLIDNDNAIMHYHNVNEDTFIHEFKKAINIEIVPIIKEGKSALAKKFRENDSYAFVYTDEAYHYLMDN